MKDEKRDHVTRRFFLGILGVIVIALIGLFYKPVVRFFKKTKREGDCVAEKVGNRQSPYRSSPAMSTIGVDDDGFSTVHIAQGKSPEENMRAVLKSLGGMEQVVSPDDIVILKPNAQWWSQGMTNTDAMKAFIEDVLAIPGFKGEVIICDNHQYAEPNSRAWITENRNGAYNYNELIAYFHSQGHRNVTKYHWQCAGPNPNPLQGDAENSSKRVQGPEDGDGYVWREDLVYESPLGRRCMLTYPIFTSSYSGTTVDLKEGAWKDGSYTKQPVKLINFSALNHHGPYVGVTASVKNFMGIVDMTCGFQGTTPVGYHNTHYIGLRDLKIPFQYKMPWRIQNMVYNYNFRYFEQTGTVLGRFMKDIRKADLNIITAHWVGYGSRTRVELSGYPKAILASKDPVALDFVASNEILLPLTRQETKDPYLLRLNDSSIQDGPLCRFLAACHEQGIGNLDAQKIRVMRCDIS